MIPNSVRFAAVGVVLIATTGLAGPPLVWAEPNSVQTSAMAVAAPQHAPCPPGPHASITEEAVKKLINELDSDKFDVRQKATEQLIGQAQKSLANTECIDRQLNASLQAKPGLEVTRRIERVLSEIGVFVLGKSCLVLPGGTADEVKVAFVAFKSAGIKRVKVTLTYTDNGQDTDIVLGDQTFFGPLDQLITKSKDNPQVFRTTQIPAGVDIKSIKVSVTDANGVTATGDPPVTCK